MRILFCGGGTAGHINPSIAIAQKLLDCDRNSTVAFVGRENGSENRLIIDAGYKLYTIKVCGLKRSFSLENIKNIYKTLKAESFAKEIINDFKPDAVLGTGGYVSFPVIRAALKMKIPAFIHESNSVPGLVTKLLAKKCNKIFLGWQTDDGKLAALKNATVTGNPVRGDFGLISRQKARKSLSLSANDLLIVSVGGSIGAEKLNNVLIEIMKHFSTTKNNITHVHGAGERFYDKIKESEPELCNGKNGCKILPYIDNMATLLSAADIAITRCGAVTLAELALCGTPSILIPSPNVTGNHQKRNAELYAKAGAAIMLEESTLTYEALEEKILYLINSPKKRWEFSRTIKKFAVPSSAEMIINEIKNDIII